MVGCRFFKHNIKRCYMNFYQWTGRKAYARTFFAKLSIFICVTQVMFYFLLSVSRSSLSCKSCLLSRYFLLRNVCGYELFMRVVT